MKWPNRRTSIAIFFALVLSGLTTEADAQPANDSILSPTSIASLPYTDTVDNTLATWEDELGETLATCGTDGLNSVWWTYTATSDGPLLASTVGSDFDTILSVYLSTPSLVEIGCDDDSGGGTGQSQEVFSATNGSVYYFRVVGNGVASGNVVMNLSTVTPDDLAGAVTVVEPLPFADTLSAVGATSESGESLPTCGSGGTNSVWWTYTPATSTALSLNTNDSDFDTILSVHTGSGHPLTEVACDDDGGSPTGRSQLTFLAKKDTSYYFRVAGFNGDDGDAALNVLIAPPDDLAGAVPIDAIPFTDTLSNVGADLETSEAAATCGTDGGNSMWWRYTADFSGTIVADTDTSGFDTILSVHTGSGHPLTEIACDDDGGSTAGHSRISFNVTSGMTYFFRVVGSGGADGDARFRLRTLPGDNLADAQPMPGVLSKDTLSTVGAGMEDNELPPSCGSGGTNSVWWTYTPSATDSLNIRSSGFDTILSIHTGAGHPLTEEACDDDGGAGDGGSSLLFKFLKDTTYYIRVAGSEGASGEAILQILVPPAFRFSIWFTGMAFLEGPYAPGSMMSVPGPFSSVVPLDQPYSDAVYDGTYLDYDGADSVLAWPGDAIDWMLISLRTGTGPGTKVIGSEKAVILLDDGSIVDTDADSVDFSVDSLGPYYVVLRHRNHLSIMSSGPVDFSSGSLGSWDFTTASSQAYGSSPMKEVEAGVWAMYGAEATLNDLNNAGDFNTWLTDTKAAVTGYVLTDFNLNGQVTAGDFNLWLTNTKAAASSGVP